MLINRATVSVALVAWAFVVVSALMVVHCKHTLRSKVSELQSLSAELERAQVELGQLLLEEGTVASYDRIDRYSADALKMRAPTHSDTIWLAQPDT